MPQDPDPFAQLQQIREARRREEEEEEEEEQRRRGVLSRSAIGIGAGLGGFATDIGAGLAGLGNVLTPGQPFAGIQEAFSTASGRLAEAGREQGLAGQIGFGVGRLGGEIAGVVSGGGLIRGAAGLAQGLGRGAGFLGRLAAPVAGGGRQLTRAGALLSGTPSATIQALGGEEASTAGAIAALTPESGVGRLAATVAESPSLRVASEAGLDVLLGGLLEAGAAGVRGLREARAPRAAAPKVEVEARQSQQFLDGELGGNNRPVGEASSATEAREAVEDMVGSGSHTLTDPRLVGEIKPEGHRIQFSQFGADDALQRDIFERQERLLLQGDVDPARRFTFEEVGRLNKEVGFDDIADAAKVNKRLPETMLTALTEIYSENFGKLANATSELRRLQGDVFARGTEEFTTNKSAIDTIESTIARLELENDTLLKIYIPEASQRGRDLAILKRMAAQRITDPENSALFWQAKLARLAGGRDLSETENARFTQAMLKLGAGDEGPILQLAQDVAPKIKVFRSSKGGIHAIGHPLITSAAGALIGSQAYEENPLAGALAGAYGGIALSMTGDAFVQIRRAGLLTGGRTQSRNALSNLGEAVLRHAESPVAALADRWASSMIELNTTAASQAANLTRVKGGRIARPVVGSRTRAFMPAARLKAGAEGAVKGVKKLADIMRAAITGDSDLAQRLLLTGPEADLNFLRRMDLIGRGRAAFENPAVNSVVNGIFAAQGAADAPFRFAAFYESLLEQASLAARVIEDPAERLAKIRLLVDAEATPAMLSVAQSSADDATFRQSNRIANALGQLERRFGGENLTDRIFRTTLGATVPFRGTPANVLARLFERAPVTGQVNTIDKLQKLIKLSKVEGIDLTELQAAQRQFADAAGRQMSGLVLAGAVGMTLASKGIMSGSLPTESAEREQWRQAGKTPDSILLDLGDGLKWRRLTGISPLGNLIAMGAQLYNDFTDPASDSLTGTVANTTAGAARAFLEQSFLRGISEPLTAITEGRGAEAALGSFAGSTVPTAVADLASLADPTLRQSLGPIQGIASRLPGVKGGLPARQDVFGEDILQFETSEEGILRLVDPFLSRRQPTDPVSRELQESDLRVPVARRGTVKAFEDESNEDFANRNRREGEELQGALQVMFDDARFQRLSPDQKQRALSSLSSRVRGYVRDHSLRGKQSWVFDIGRALASARGN